LAEVYSANTFDPSLVSLKSMLGEPRLSVPTLTVSSAAPVMTVW
jgi:hypothetical protein